MEKLTAGQMIGLWIAGTVVFALLVTAVVIFIEHRKMDKAMKNFGKGK